MKEEDKTTPLRIEATLSLFNATRQPFTGTPAFPHLPEGWSADEAPAPIQNLEPLHSARRLVRARAASIEPNDEGILPIPLWVTAGAPLPQPTLGRLSLLTSQRLARPPAIDGRLDDWPLGAGNVAGDFVLVGALDVPKEGRPSPDSPSQGTTVFVCHDDNYLYIAFNCQDDRLKERAVPRSNTVRYEDLWPVGEELLEVVLDPTGRAVEPGDVLHILVKANGAVIAEHGAPCLTHVAENKEWAVNVGAAVDDQSQKDRWTAEIRIPLSSLGKRPAVWGINFGRFQARLGEYSSWSGARQYLYSPVSLGNIRLDN